VLVGFVIGIITGFNSQLVIFPNFSLMRFNSYITFGLRRHWLEDFLLRAEEFFPNHTLGPQQIKAFKRYLKPSELITPKGELVPLYFQVKEIFEKKATLLG